jgi:hypothetical protein
VSLHGGSFGSQEGTLYYLSATCPFTESHRVLAWNQVFSQECIITVPSEHRSTVHLEAVIIYGSTLENWRIGEFEGKVCMVHYYFLVFWLPALHSRCLIFWLTSLNFHLFMAVSQHPTARCYFSQIAAVLPHRSPASRAQPVPRHPTASSQCARP